MNDFIVGALEEAAADNYLLMPYFDLLQFQESLKEQLATLPLVQNLYEMLSKHIEKLNPPKALTLSEEDYADIELHALRVALISNTLKNPKKDHTRLETEYNSKF